MSLIIPHRLVQPQQHTALPYLWRVACSCGWTAFASNRDACLAAHQSHQAEEDPFPDLSPEDLKGPNQ